MNATEIKRRVERIERLLEDHDQHAEDCWCGLCRAREDLVGLRLELAHAERRQVAS